MSTLAMHRTLALTRLELSDALRSRWLQFTVVIDALVFGVFVWLGLRESSVLGFTGLSRVLLHMANATVIAVPLVALVATCQAVARARTTGHLELLLSQPVRRSEWFASLLTARLVVLLGPLLALIALTGLAGLLLGGRDAALGPMALHALLVSTTLLWAYVGIGLLVSAYSRTLERAVVLALLAWLLSAALHDFALIGLLLQWRLPPALVFGLAALNPVEAARIAVLSTVDPELSVLGPVGFFIANELGPRLAYTLGLLWPAVVGSVSLLVAARHLRRSDAVA
jgi:ABC-2 type transport system permease protein